MIVINKQTIISHHYHQQTNNHLSPLPSTDKQSSLTININKLMEMVRDDCFLLMVMVRGLFVNVVNRGRWLFVCWW
jgi:hypothetical protein